VDDRGVIHVVNTKYRRRVYSQWRCGLKYGSHSVAKTYRDYSISRSTLVNDSWRTHAAEQTIPRRIVL